MERSLKQIELITDGSCLGNPGPGGWAAILRYGDHEKLVTGGAPDTTNNRMELTAVIEGLKLVNEPCAIKITSDSKYVIDAFRQGWIDGWRRNGWRNAKKKPVKNQDLWMELDELLGRHQISWQWVEGHSGDPDNERVDEAARQAAGSILSD